MAQAYDERAARRQYVRRRQQTVFTIAGTAMVVVLVVALLFFFHVFGLGKVNTPVEQPNYGVTAPCATAADDGTSGTTVNTPSVTIRVLNGTEFSGFAQAVSKGLENRGFVLQSFDTYRDAQGAAISNVERTTIYFGRNAINEAYTLNDNFTDAVMVMDNREDKLIDVVLGATFKDLKDIDEVLAPGSPITDFSNCKPADQITDLPQAIAH